MRPTKHPYKVGDLRLLKLATQHTSPAPPPPPSSPSTLEASMPGIPIPSGEGRRDARDRRSIPVSELLTPFPAPVREYFCKYSLDLIGEIWSGLSHLPFDEALEALGKKLREYSRSKERPVHTSEDEEEDDEDEEDDDEMEEDEKDMEGETLKLLDDGKKPLCAEEHQACSESERECKKPRIS